ncbi:MAG: hypothetical protein KF841_15065 [Phycisphaerae bacterium]|nr:hypothetical protein [Phycisphaerae bacterium]
MSTFPRGRTADFIEWCQAHDPVFIENATDIGLTASQADDFAEATLKAHLKIVAQREAMQAAMVATQEARAAVALLRAEASRAVLSIRSHAENAKNPLAIYNKAQIAPPAVRSVGPAPVTPKNLIAVLEAATGSLMLRWKCAQPEGASGTVYMVRRRLPGETEFRFIGASGQKFFEDAKLPVGVKEVEYTVQAIRGPREGSVSPVLLVRIGTVKGETVSASAPAAQILPAKKSVKVGGFASR